MAMATKPHTTKVVRQRRTPELQLIEHESWGPGLHVAPFKNGWGGLAIIAVDADGRLAGTFDVRSGNSSWETCIYIGRNAENPDEMNYDDTDLFSSVDLIKRLGHAFWEPGVHLCPWKPRLFSDGVAVLTIAPNGDRWDYHEVPAVTPEVRERFEESLTRASVDGSRPSAYDYSEYEHIAAGEHGRLLRMEKQYEQDRAEYGRLIARGSAAKDPADSDE